MNKEQYPKDFWYIVILTAIIVAVYVIFFSACGPHNPPQPPEKPTPTPVADTHVIAQGKQIFLNGAPIRFKGLGLYFSWERKLSDAYLHDLFSYLREYDINLIRVFVISTFQKHRLQELGVPAWQIFKQTSSGQYDLDEINTDWLAYIRNYCQIANRHGIVIMPVLSDICGFKNYGVDEYGWPTSAFNHVNNRNGRYTYDGAAFFKFYHIDRQDKYPQLSATWERVVRNVVNVLCQCPNVVFELGNELEQDPSHEPYALLQNFMNHLHMWTVSQYQNSGSPYSPVFANSDAHGYFWGDNRVNIQWSHDHLNTNTQYNGCSTDGARASEFYNDPNAYRARMQYLYSTGHHIEMHMAFMTTAIGVQPEYLMCHVWGNDVLVNPRVQWEAHLKPWLTAIKNVK